MALTIPWFKNPSLQNAERIHFCCCKFVVICYGKPWKLTQSSNSLLWHFGGCPNPTFHLPFQPPFILFCHPFTLSSLNYDPPQNSVLGHFFVLHSLWNIIQFYGFSFTSLLVTHKHKASVGLLSWDLLLMSYQISKTDVKRHMFQTELIFLNHFLCFLLHYISFHSFSIPVFSCTIFGSKTKARNLNHLRSTLCSSPKSQCFRKPCLFYYFKFPWINYFPRSGSYQFLFLSDWGIFLTTNLAALQTIPQYCSYHKISNTQLWEHHSPA